MKFQPDITDKILEAEKMEKGIINARLFFIAGAVLCLLLTTFLPAESSDVPVAENANHQIAKAENGGGDYSGEKSSNQKTENTISITLAVIIACIVTFSFFVILCLGWKKEHAIDKGVFRRAVAGALVIGYIFIVMMSLCFDFCRKEILSLYAQLVSMVVAFYFGAKVGSEAPNNKIGNNADKGQDKQDSSD